VTAEKTPLRVGDLVEVVYLSNSSSYFPWATCPVPAIYMGVEEFKYISSRCEPNNTPQNFIHHKVYSMGKIRYITSRDELRLLGRGSQ
tara:strand:- start:119 stop:382 length:264 start_codon:yes stop_codon:yes gene_type:complete